MPPPIPLSECLSKPWLLSKDLPIINTFLGPLRRYQLGKGVGEGRSLD